MTIWVKICKYLNLGKNFRKISILVNIYENHDLGLKLQNRQFWS